MCRLGACLGGLWRRIRRMRIASETPFPYNKVGSRRWCRVRHLCLWPVPCILCLAMLAPNKTLARLIALYYVVVITSASLFHTHSIASRRCADSHCAGPLSRSPDTAAPPPVCPGHGCHHDSPCAARARAADTHAAHFHAAHFHARPPAGPQTKTGPLVAESRWPSDCGECPICSFLANKPFSAEKAPAPASVKLPEERVAPAVIPFVLVIRFTWRHRAPPLLA